MKIAALIFISVWSWIFALMAIMGLIEANSNSKYRINECKAPKERISYIFPGYQAGCWLGQSVE